MGPPLQEWSELLNRQTGAFQDGSQRSRFDGLGAMNRDDGSPRHISGMSQKDVRTVLPEDHETGLLESTNKTSARELRQEAHAVTSTSLKITSSRGTGIPSSRRPVRYNSIASRIFASASSWVSPWLAHPGRLGTDTENPPEDSGSSKTRKRRSIMTLTSIRHSGALVKHAPVAFLLGLIGMWAPEAQAVPTVSGETRITREVLPSGGQVQATQPLRLVTVGEPFGGLITGPGVALRVGHQTGSPILMGLDITPPTITQLVPAATSPVRVTPVRLRGLVSDDRTSPGSIHLRVNGQAASLDAAGWFSHEVSLSEGPNTLLLEASDASGNTARQQHVVLLETDAAAPPDDSQPQAEPVLVRIGSAQGHPGDQVSVRSTVTVGEATTLDQVTLELLHDPTLVTVVSTQPAGTILADRVRLTLDQGTPLTDGEGLSMAVTYALGQVAQETTTILDAANATAQDGGGHVVSVTVEAGTLVILPRPAEAELQVSPTTGTAPLGVDFFIGVPEGITPIKYEWDCDGLGRFDHVTYVPFLHHVYHAPSDYLETGSYLPSVRMTSLSGGELLPQTFASVVTVARDPMTPAVSVASSVSAGEAPLRVQLSATVSSTSRIAAYRWDFDGDGVFEVHRASLSEVVTTYPEAGSYAPTVEVIDVEGRVARASAAISVDMDPALSAPISEFASTPAQGAVPLTPTFQNGGSLIPVMSHEWDYEGDGVVDALLLGTRTETPYYEAGIYTPEVRVTADNGIATRSAVNVSVLPQAQLERPVFEVRVSRERRGVTKAATVPLQDALVVGLPEVIHIAVQIDPASVPIDRLEIDAEGDGTVEYLSKRNGVPLQTDFSHRYRTIGHYSLLVRAVSRDGQEARRHVPVSVLAPRADGRNYLMWLSPERDALTVAGSELTLLVDGAFDVQPEEVVFECRLPGTSEWTTIASTGSGHPYHVVWQLGDVPQDTYEILAKAVLPDGSTIEAEPLTLRVAQQIQGAQVTEAAEAGGTRIINRLVSPDEEARVAKPDGTSVEIPVEVTAQAVNLRLDPLTQVEVAQPLSDFTRALQDAGIYHDIGFVDGPTEFDRPVVMTLPYADEDQDGLVDGTAIDETTLRAYRFDGAAWVPLLEPIIDPAANTVTFRTNHFSLFGLGGLFGGSGGSGGDDGNRDHRCFIATAAFGSSLAPELNALRAFRDRRLMAHPLGRLFVRTYYRVSPSLAAFISRHEGLRAVVRATLRPVVGWAQRAIGTQQSAVSRER